MKTVSLHLPRSPPARTLPLGSGKQELACNVLLPLAAANCKAAMSCRYQQRHIAGLQQPAAANGNQLQGCKHVPLGSANKLQFKNSV